MKTLRFKIYGNHKSETGNAVPKLKMTGKQSWTIAAQEYVLWKEHVVDALMESLDEVQKTPFNQNVVRFGKPIVLPPSAHALMLLKVNWSNKAHGDPENIFGSIADALFKNDKNLDVMVYSFTTDTRLNGKPRGYVDVSIRIFADEADKVHFIKQLAINI